MDRGSRLVGFLLISFMVIYGANIPVHHGLLNPLVPSLIPWLAAAGVAIWRFQRKQSCTPAWLTLASIGGFLLLGHILPK
jgi:hypothetical protein